MPRNTSLTYGGARHIAWRRFINRMMLCLTGALALTLMMPLFGILGYLISKGAGSINWAFFTQLPKPVGEDGGGVANAIVGSIMVISLGALFAIPIGIMAAVYIHEFHRGSKFAASVRFVCDMLNATPSIILGIFAYGVIVMPMVQFSAMAGAFALFVMMTPIIVRGTEEILRTVPDSIRAASLALGSSRWQTIRRVVLPAAKSGIATAICLSLARIGGETAPLLFTAVGNDFWSFSLTEPINTLPVQIFKFASAPYADWHRQAWAAALFLVVMITLTNAAARFVTRKGNH